MLGREKSTHEKLYSWCVYLITGLGCGFAAFIVDFIVEELVLLKWQLSQNVMHSSIHAGMLVFVTLSVLFATVSALLCVYIAPGAIASGIAELMAYMNGIQYPNFLTYSVLGVKIFALGLSVAAGLCVGKEGPLAHIGAIIGIATLYLPLNFTKKFRNESSKRELACAGAAAGVSAAFAAPIGGTLFMYETTRPSTFWSFEMTWKIFFCSSVSTFVLNIFSCIKKGEDISITNAGLIKFGSYDSQPYEFNDFPFFVVLGVCGGLLGSFFNYMNVEINVLRRVYLNKPWKRVLETACITALTAIMIFYAPLITATDCEKEDNLSQAEVDSEFIQYTCDEHEYNPLATLLLNPEGNTIKALMNKNAIFAYNPLLVHFLIWFLMTICTYGTAVPAGLFLPGILIGCSLGRMLTLFISTNIETSVSPATYSIIGAASVLAGYSRMSFSLAVIMLETTENVNLFLPMIFSLFISFAVGRLFNRSIYIAALGSKNVPFLIETVPYFNSHLRAKDIMSETLQFLP